MRGRAVLPPIHGGDLGAEERGGLGHSPNALLAVLTLTPLTLTELGPPAHTGSVLCGAKLPM